MNALTTNQVMSVARRNHWWFRILGQEQPITQPVYKNGWWFIPIQEDKSIIPFNAISRVEELQKAGVLITRVIVAHEAPKVLPGPYVQPIQIPWRKLGKGIAVSLGAVGSVLVTILSAFATVFVAVMPVLLSLLVMMPLAMIDPALIVQLPDGTMISVYEWLVR